MAYDDQRAWTVLFGGAGASGYLGDTWSWDGSAWIQRAASGPAARSGHTMAHDARRGRTVLFGGRDGGSFFGDTWEWDGSTWTQVPVAGPAPRHRHGLAFDSQRGRSVLFGGAFASGYLADTWEWDGAVWFAHLFATGPSARQSPGIAYDAQRARSVLFGGLDASGPLGDTWDWDGLAWRHRSSFGPTPRAGHAVVYDAGRGRCVLFGGMDGASPPNALGDTLEWDGSIWVPRLVTATIARSDHAVAYDARRAMHVLFGGTVAGSRLGDTWERQGPSFSSATPYGSGCGNPPLELWPVPGANPNLNSTAMAQVTQVPGSVAFVAAGLSRAWFGPFPLPVTLAGFGMPGCFLLQSSEAAALPATPTGTGSASFSLQVPNSISLLGFHLYLQAWAHAPGQNPANTIASNGLDWCIGNRSPVLAAITEEFLDDSKLDRDVSSGTWAGGLGTFGPIGGDGRHGTFAPELGTSLGLINGKRTFVFDTDATTIPAANTRPNVPLSISDGRFWFDKMVVPGDVRLRFTGSRPPQFTVAGKIDVLGEIDVAGATLTSLPVNSQYTGQLGGAGGIFGGSGGQGGDKCLGTGYLPNYDGRAGGDASVLGGRAYAASTSGTGGSGSHVFPVSGLSAALIFAAPTGVNYTPSAAAGGGGGGLRAAGDTGRVVSNNHPDPVLLVPPRLDAMGPPAAGGTAVQFFPWPAAGGTLRASEHFLVGGSGGGGAGSHACLCIAAVNPRVWSPGGGGGGGGGALSLRAGDSLSIGALGRVNASGGAAASSSGITASSSPPPGGGGSGGSVVLQSGRLAMVQGVIDVRGGNGGTFNRSSSVSTPPSGASVQIAGGNGSAGFVRCELPGTVTTAVIANALPAPTPENVGTLVEQDELVAFQSTWYSTNLAQTPDYLRYEIVATVDGQQVLFSDDPAVSPIQATFGAPVRAFFQSANLDLVTGVPVPLPGQTQPAIRRWYPAVRATGSQPGMVSDGLNGFRFALVFDRSQAISVTIDRVSVYYRV
ncbi:MAG: hypothetical protein FJ265_13370 [Planctomycetes bacterium]|nr:hypothetical protein [Planctomycetota bacterium]